jgi:hypothetical protein
VVSRASSTLGVADALGATLANLGCCGAGLLGPAAGLAALSGLLHAAVGAWGYETMYASLALAAAGLATSAWRRRSVGALLSALVGVAGLLLASHESWDVTLFYTHSSWAGPRRWGRQSRGTSSSAPAGPRDLGRRA